MNRASRITWVLLVLLCHQPAAAQGTSRFRDKAGDKRLKLALEVRQYPTADPDSALIRLYTRITMNQLVFVRQGQAFKAEYEISIFAMDDDEKVRVTKIWREEVLLEDYRETRSDEQARYPTTSLTLMPGDYKIIAHITDLANRRRYSTTKEVTVKRYADDELALSDFILVSQAPRKSDRPVEIIPQFKGQIADDVDSIYVYLVIWNPTGGPLLATCEYTLKDSKEEAVTTKVDTLELNDALTDYWIPMATKPLLDREYTLEVELSAGELSVSREFPINIVWTGISRLIKDIDKAIDQTRYLATHSELKKMRATKDKEERRKLLLEFWEGRDPTPGTPRNELMDEYYRRVAYSNIHFRSYQAGWESDLGMVYITYGPPDDIERHPFDARSKPYQIWRYYDKGWRFVFVDVNMFGDYRLVTPLYPTGR